MKNTIEFYKYQGTGNDFIMIDNRDLQFPKQQPFIEKLCDRRFGIGGDGLILLETDENDAFDFRMVYYNADGNESTMCGNGGRCLVAFAHFLDVFEEKCRFIAIDGPHEAQIDNGIVKLKMIDVEKIEKDGEDFVLNTGSPHYVRYVDSLQTLDVYQEGRNLRNAEAYKSEGINVNFVEKKDDQTLFVRTYERGVEDETYSCGTGATAAALTFLKSTPKNSVAIKVLGGNLKVYAEQNNDHFHNIWLEGPAQQVFRGKIDL
ncbi:diaminopimelate epimerase [Bergeyella sp. RCAD1439]|uniref:diaminopimelate epimerase n=1 Tax=Bergeyella anatis TaxID=3113737 RepID=UPI002E17FD11|nr:diaminopimelate epimerase [Bergeyella sp. RCAD1439]